MTLDILRQKIDNIDFQIAALLQQRAILSIKVGDVKNALEPEASCFRPERETEVLANISSVKGALSVSAIRTIYQQILSSSRALQYVHRPKKLSGKVLVVGLGLIGGSVALALKNNTKVEVSGIDISHDHVRQALDLQLVDTATTEYNKNISQANLIVIATPVDSIGAVLRQLKPYITDQTIITDVASTKQSSVASAQEVLGDQAAQFVPGHPLAGTEYAGPKAALADLFQSQPVILTPFTSHAHDALQMVKDFWHDCGAVVSELDAKEHDDMLALTSHLPHVLAFSFINCCGHHPAILKKYSANSFHGIARIANSLASMWVPIVMNNQGLLPLIEMLRQKLADVEQAIKANDADFLREFFESGRELYQKLTG